jgi:hypothetical protein
VGPTWARLGALLLLGFASPALAQEPTGHELGLQALTTIADPTFGGAGVSYALRFGGRMRLTAAAVPGSSDGDLAMRGELALHFLLDPSRRSGAGVYGIGGIAGIFGRQDAGYLMLGLGVETRPGGSSGWMIEAGVAGGFRLAIGWRRRWLHWPGRMP